MMDWSTIRFFKREEFSCCCGTCGGYPAEPDEELVRLLDELRRVVDRPLHITSGLRCPDWNAEAGGVADSGHLSGKAVDVAVLNSRERYELISLGLVAFTRVGIGKTFIHFDNDGSKPDRVVWLYGDR